MIHSLNFFLRILKRNKTFSAIAIAGFTLSLTIVILLSSFVFHELSYDQFHAQIDRIYRLIDQNGSGSINEDVVESLQNDYPEIEAACRYNIYSGEIANNGQPYELNHVLHTEPAFFKIFDLHFIQGSPETALTIQDNVILSEKIAKKIFGDENPVGKALIFNHEYSMLVSGVIRDLQENSSFQPEIIIHRDLRTNIEGSTMNGVETFYNRFFILVNPVADADELAKKLSAGLQQQNLIENDVQLIPFKKSYFSSLSERSHLKHANLSLILILTGIGLVILFISALNFIILFTAHHMTRLKEIGLKRTIGMNRLQVFIQFLFEAMLICSLSFIISVFMAEFLHPYFENIVSKSFPVWAAFQFPNIIYLIIGVMTIAILSGWYPALMVSRLQPQDILRSGDSKSMSSLKMKSRLLTIQYTVTIMLIVSLLVISKQVDYVKNKNLGFTSEQLIRLKVHWNINQKLPVLKQELMNHAHIISVTSSNGTPGVIHCWQSWPAAQEKGWNSSVAKIPVDHNFFNVFDPPFIHGRDFRADEQRAVIINETAWKIVGWETLAGKEFEGRRIVGVVKDIHVANLHQKIAPTIFEIDDDSHTYVTLRVSPGDMQNTLAYIRDVWHKIVPDFVLDLQFYDEWVNTFYQAEDKLAYTIRMFVIITIMLACLGTFGVIRFVVSRRTKEIGIRKVSGARTLQIVALLNADFIKWVGIAFLIATPLSWIGMKLWLQSFAYRTELSWWIFALAGAMALVIALLTVSWQAIRAATANPVDSLRYE